MKKRSKLKLNRETIASLDPQQLRVAGGDCTCSCCYTGCDCPAPTQYYSCLNTCDCTTYNNEFSCICA